MPPKRDPQVEKAAKLFAAALDALKMTLPMVMRATGFSTAFGRQATIKKIKLNAEINTMNIDELNKIESKV